MRIGFFTDSYLPRADGIATSIEAYRAGLEALGHEVYVFCPSHPKKFTEPSPRIIRFKSIPSPWYDNYRDTFPFLPFRKQQAGKLKLDIIQTFSQTQMGIFGMQVAKKYHVPLIGTCNTDFNVINEYPLLPIASPLVGLASCVASHHIVGPREFKSLLHARAPRDGKRQWLAKAGTALYFNECDVVTVQSEKIRKDIGGYITKPFYVLPVGTDLSLVPKDPDVTAIRAQYHLPEEKVLFVSSCRLVKEKRVDMIIKSYAAFSADERSRSALVIVGDGRERKNLDKLVSSLAIKTNVTFTGSISQGDVLRVVSASDIYLHTSLRETQGLVLNEAAACGKPLIMIDRDVNPVLQEGGNGLFAHDSMKDFSEKMRILLDDKAMRERFGKRSKELAKTMSQEIVSKKLSDLYEEILHQEKAK